MVPEGGGEEGGARHGRQPLVRPRRGDAWHGYRERCWRLVWGYREEEKEMEMIGEGLIWG